MSKTSPPAIHQFLVKTNREVDEWMDSFYVDGRKSDFRLHCQWAWQEQEQRHNAVEAELISALESALIILTDSVGDFDYDKAIAAIAKARGEA